MGPVFGLSPSLIDQDLIRVRSVLVRCCDRGAFLIP